MKFLAPQTLFHSSRSRPRVGLAVLRVARMSWPQRTIIFCGTHGVLSTSSTERSFDRRKSLEPEGRLIGGWNTQTGDAPAYRVRQPSRHLTDVVSSEWTI